MKTLLALAGATVLGLAPLPAADKEMSASQFPLERYVILALTEDQLEEVETRRRISLTREQLKVLRELAPAFPKRLGVVSPFVRQIPNTRFAPWDDQVTAIWFCRSKVAIPRASLEGVPGYREFNNNLNDRDAVLVRTSGDLLIGSRQVDHQRLVKTLDALAGRQPDGARFGIFVLRPPVLQDPGEEQAVREAVGELAELCEERGLECFVGG